MPIPTTLPTRLALEAEADRLADAAAEALAVWRDLATRHAAAELALQNLPLVVPTPTPAALAAAS